jgi:hypothetical protein
MKEVHDNCVEVDTARAMRILKEVAPAEDAAQEGVPAEEQAPEYPKEGYQPR